MSKSTIRDLDLSGARVFIRVDFNVPLDNGQVADDLRLRRAMETIQYGISHGAILILASHLGRPKGTPSPELSLAPAGARLAELLGRQVRFVPDCVGPEVENAVGAARPGDVILLENLRFYAEEEANDRRFAKKLGRLAQYYCNDAFGTAHRAHASTDAITSFADRAVAGFLMEKELHYLGESLKNPERPFIAILGGAKISDKIEVIQEFLQKVDRILIGGAMSFTFLKSQGIGVGKSLCEVGKLELARDLLSRAPEVLVLPVDTVSANSIEDQDSAHEVAMGAIPPEEMGLDIGSKTVASYRDIIGEAKTIVWNGPMGVFEKDAFAGGTLAIARAVAASEAQSIIGGGDSAAAVHKAGVAQEISHISTGGGASLELLAGRTLPGVAALEDQ